MKNHQSRSRWVKNQEKMGPPGQETPRGDRDSILTKLLGQSDAVYLPLRDWHGVFPVNVYFARRNFRMVGVPWASNEISEGGRKASQRGLEELAAAGLVTTCKPRKTKVLFARLTDEAEIQIRKLCGIPGRSCSWSYMVELARLSKRGGKKMEDVWVSERLLAQPALPMDEALSGEQTEGLALVQDMFLFALVRGHVVSHSAMDRNAYYALTTLGWGLIDKAEAPHNDDFEGEFSKEARSLYFSEVEAGRTHLGGATSEDTREIGMIPLPVHHVGCQMSYNPDNYCFFPQHQEGKTKSSRKVGPSGKSEPVASVRGEPPT